MNETISRRKLLFFAGLAASLVAPATVLIASNAEAQQAEQTPPAGQAAPRRKRQRRRGPQAPVRPLRQSNRRHSSHRDSKRATSYYEVALKSDYKTNFRGAIRHSTQLTGLRDQPSNDLGTLSGRAAPPRAAFMAGIHISSQ
jgi:hypothetical protein